MAVLLKAGGVFLHIPKTGGNWVTEVLEAQGLVFAHFGEKHASRPHVVDFERWFRTPAKYDKPNRPFFKFCFVRHPFGWYESWFRMQRALGWPAWGGTPAVWHPCRPLNGLGANDFNAFVSNVVERIPGFLSRMYGFYVGGDVHYVGRRERLLEDLHDVLSLLGHECSAEVIGRHKPTNVGVGPRIQWDPIVRKRLVEAELSAFEQFGYSAENEEMIGKARSGRSLGLLRGLPDRLPIRPPFAREDPHGWLAPVPGYGEWADGPAGTHASLFLLLEDGRPLGPAHATHEVVRKVGMGAFSHWMDNLYFSTSDNSDPNQNRRSYSLRFAYGLKTGEDRLQGVGVEDGGKPLEHRGGSWLNEPHWERGGGE